MQSRTGLLLLLGTLCTSLASCAPKAPPGPDMSPLWAFQLEHSRWPRDISEVQAFSDSHSLAFDSSRYRTFEISSGNRWVAVWYEAADGTFGSYFGSVSPPPDAGSEPSN